MPKIKSRLHSNKHKPKMNQELNNTKSNLLQIFNLSNKNNYQEMVPLCINELRRFLIIR